MLSRGGCPGVSPAEFGSRVRSTKGTNGVDTKICRRPARVIKGTSDKIFRATPLVPLDPLSPPDFIKFDPQNAIRGAFPADLQLQSRCRKFRHAPYVNPHISSNHVCVYGVLDLVRIQNLVRCVTRSAALAHLLSQPLFMVQVLVGLGSVNLAPVVMCHTCSVMLPAFSRAIVLNGQLRCAQSTQHYPHQHDKPVCVHLSRHPARRKLVTCWSCSHTKLRHTASMQASMQQTLPGASK
jgi:hypothetical protein